MYENVYINVGSGDVFEMTVHNAVYMAIQKQYRCVEFKFADAAVMAQAKESLFNAGVIYSVFDEIGLINKEESAKVYFSVDDKLNTMCIFF